MQVTQERLQTIILEEYLKEEGFIDEAMSRERADEFIAWIKGEGEKPEWLDRDYGPGSYQRKKSAQAPANDPNVDRSAETMPFPQPDAPDDTPEPEDAAAAESNPIKATVDGIYELVSDMDPEDVQEIFQIVFEKLPGVEMMSPGDEGYPEEKPPTEYVRGAMGRPKISTFGLDEIKQLIRKVLTEGDYHDDDEMYDLSIGERPPAHNTATEEEPDKYEKLTTAYHALEDAVGQHPELQDALDSVAGLLDAMDTGDSMYRADENIDAEQ